LGIPVHLGEPAVQAGLVGGGGELAVDAADGLALGDEQSGEVLAEMLTFGCIGEQFPKLFEAFLHDGRELDNGWHLRTSLVMLKAASVHPIKIPLLTHSKLTLQKSR